MSDDACAIGIDVGGTKIAAGLVAAPARILARRLEPTRPERGGDAVLADVIAIAQSLCDEARRLGVAPTGIGVGLAELVGVDGRVLSAATVDWQRLAPGNTIQAATGLATVLDADVRAAARAEASAGAGRGLPSFLYVTIGTGISASLVVAGAPLVGARGLTGTFASARGQIPGDDGRLAVGPPLEQFAAGPALAARLAAARPGFTGAAPAVLSLAEDGDDDARRVVASAGDAVGAAIAQLVNMLDPAAVVLGGGLGLAGGLYAQRVDAALRQYVWAELHRDIPLHRAQLGNDAGLIGAALAAGVGP